MRNLEKGQHIFIAFQNGKAVLDSQLRPRMYTSLENADRWTPTVNKGKIEYVEYAPTLTPPNEPLTLELVAEILAEQFGDECACNFNGNDEWLPMMCHYGDVCPDPPEHLGCWMELLRNKYCRPPEGGDADHA